MRYYSDVLNKLFNTIEEVNKAEQEQAEKVAAEKKKRDERERREKEVDEAFTHAYELRAAYLKDYGSYAYTYGLPFFELFNNNKRTNI